MAKIKHKSDYDDVSLRKKVKKQFEAMNKTDPKAINAEVMRILQKNCDSSFKSTEREARINAFASKTNPPAVGKYTPRYTQVDAAFRDTRYFPEKENEGFRRKKDLNMKTMHICPHTIRVIEDWAGKKISPTRGGSVMVSPTEGLKAENEQQQVSSKKHGQAPAADFEEGVDGEKTPSGGRSATCHVRNRSDIARGTLPNKSPIFVRILKNESPV
jgi:hypothetical protein